MIRIAISSLLLVFISVLVFCQINLFDSTGKASFYHDSLHGEETSSGEDYDKNDFTAAHRTLPFNTIVSVTNKLNGKNVIVRINDRGPFKRSRIIDLTRSGAMKLGMVRFGVVPVKIHILNILDKLPMNDSLIKNGEVLNCYGKKSKLNNFSIIVWQTEFVKHAFYMASSILLDYHLEEVVVRTKGDMSNRSYQVIITSLKEKSKCDSLLNIMIRDGFRNARLLK